MSSHVVDFAALQRARGRNLNDLVAPAPKEHPAPAAPDQAPAPKAELQPEQPVSLDVLAAKLRARLAYLDAEIDTRLQLETERNKVRRLLQAIGTED